MKRSLGVIMDPIETINVKKDSTFAMLLQAQKRQWDIHYFNLSDLWLDAGTAFGTSQGLRLMDDPSHYFDKIGEPADIELGKLDCILMRKDPPFDMEYIYATYILERAAEAGAMVVNAPQALRDVNEKMYIKWFADCCAPTRVARLPQRIHEFVDTHNDVILKPLDGMGGASIFRCRSNDPNRNVIVETLTDHGRRFIMAQKFIPEITEGDKRILLVNGEPIPYALARIPASGETRGNLAVGGRGVGQPLSERDLEICRRVGPELTAKGLMFVGLDVIGDYLTEINVTSPTCIRELDAQFGLDIAQTLFDAIELKL